jgi:hypothetical protein
VSTSGILRRRSSGHGPRIGASCDFNVTPARPDLLQLHLISRFRLTVRLRFGQGLPLHSHGVLTAGLELCPLCIDAARGVVRAGLQLIQPAARPSSAGTGPAASDPGVPGVDADGSGSVEDLDFPGRDCSICGSRPGAAASGSSGPASGLRSGGHGRPSRMAAWCWRSIARSTASACAWNSCHQVAMLCGSGAPPAAGCCPRRCSSAFAFPGPVPDPPSPSDTIFNLAT